MKDLIREKDFLGLKDTARASISQDYWRGDIKEDWGSGGWKSPSGVQGRSPGWGSGGRPPEAEAFLCNYT